jgi:hypothetical protein
MSTMDNCVDADRAVQNRAIIILLEPHVHGGDDISFLEYARSALDDAISTTANSASIFVQRDANEPRPGSVSPFIIPWLYIAAKKCILDDRQKSLVQIETAIARFERRWRAASPLR